MRVSIQVAEIDECRNVKCYEFEIEKFSKRGRGGRGGGVRFFHIKGGVGKIRGLF